MPNGADLQRLNGDFGPVEPDSVVYTGAMTYHVNFDAMKFFLNEVWPKIQARRPTARLYVCGTTEGVSLDALPQHASVTFTGHLGDIRPRLARSWVGQWCPTLRRHRASKYSKRLLWAPLRS